MQCDYELPESFLSSPLFFSLLFSSEEKNLWEQMASENKVSHFKKLLEDYGYRILWSGSVGPFSIKTTKKNKRPSYEND